MHLFYLNECLPDSLPDDINFQNEFCILIEKFKDLKKEISEVDGIVTEKLPSEIMICNCNLADTINSIENKSLKRIAYSYFNKYPIATYFEINEETSDEILEKSYKFDGKDALNLAIISHNNGFLLTIPVELSLKINQFVLNGNNSTINVDNWFGEQQNTDYIIDKIQSITKETLDDVEALKLKLIDCELDCLFLKNFNNCSSKIRKLIISRFQQAIDNKLLFPVKSDDDIIKKTQGKGNENTYELRNKSYLQLRVYFSEINGVVYIGGMEYKSNSIGVEQNADICRASKKIEKLILLRKKNDYVKT